MKPANHGDDHLLPVKMVMLSPVFVRVFVHLSAGLGKKIYIPLTTPHNFGQIDIIYYQFDFLFFLSGVRCVFFVAARSGGLRRGERL